jgi:hypothetical protein
LRHVEVGRLTGRGRPFPADPDAAEELLDKLTACRVLDVSLLVPVSPDGLTTGRARMRLELSRHGRVSMDYWEGRDVNEMRYAHAMLLEMVRKERPATVGEDGG